MERIDRSKRAFGQIGTAWTGTHVLLLTCLVHQDWVVSFSKSRHAPVEPISESCAEALSTLLSIGYSVHYVAPVSDHLIQYILTKQ